MKVPAIYEFENGEAVYAHLFCSAECASRWKDSNQKIEESDVVDSSFVCERCNKRLIKRSTNLDVEKVEETYYKVYCDGKIYEIIATEFESEWMLKCGNNNVAKVFSVNEALNWLITYRS